MNYLTICKRVNDLVGFQGIVTSVNPTGYQKVLVQAVNDSYEDIQRFRRDWEYMKATKEVNVDSSASYYTLDSLWSPDVPDLASWLYVNYDHQRLVEYSYDAYELIDKDAWEGSEPQFWSQDPATKGLYISPLDGLYTLDIYYVKTLDVLTTATQIPRIPDRFHQAIVYGAVMNLSTFVGNSTLYDTYSVKYSTIMGQLMREENPAKFVRKRPIA